MSTSGNVQVALSVKRQVDSNSFIKGFAVRCSEFEVEENGIFQEQDNTTGNNMGGRHFNAWTCRKKLELKVA
jgi:hypothetical protein